MAVKRRGIRVRSGAEVAFLILRVLAAARLFWSDRGALPLDALPALVAASAETIALAVERLCREGIAEVSAGTGTLRLTERGARELCLGNPPASLRSSRPSA